jgi:hypothetical protein
MKLMNLYVSLLNVIICMIPFSSAFAGTLEHDKQIGRTELFSIQIISDNHAQEKVTEPNSVRMIPAATAITVAFPKDLTLDAGVETSTTLVLAQPIYDENGNEAVPTNSLIGARLKPVKKGVEILTDFLVIRGKTVPIQVSSVVVPGQTVTLKSGMENAREASQIGGKLGGTLFGAVDSENIKNIKGGALAGTGLGILTGILSPKKATVVKISQGSIFILSLQSPVVLP